ncbi:MAG: hypothetical protein WDN48_01845 [Pseudolabrys sp.]
MTLETLARVWPREIGDVFRQTGIRLCGTAHIKNRFRESVPGHKAFD